MRNDILLVIEDYAIKEYNLSDKEVWLIGRGTGENVADIDLATTTISRKHGKLEKQGNIWIYSDLNSSNGSVYNGNAMLGRLDGTYASEVIHDNDMLVLGSSSPTITGRKVVVIYKKEIKEGKWRIIDTKGYAAIDIDDGDEVTALNFSKVGTIISKKGSVAIYLGDYSFALGDIKVMGK